MNDRRENDLHMNTIIGILDEIKETQKEHGYVITRNCDDIEAVSKKLDGHMGDEEQQINVMEKAITELREVVEPVIALMHDVAAVGKFGHWLKTSVIWLAIVGGAFVAIYEYIRHFGDKP